MNAVIGIVAGIILLCIGEAIARLNEKLAVPAPSQVVFITGVLCGSIAMLMLRL